MVVLQTAIAGLGAGAAYALLGLSTLITFRFVAVVNFAQTAVGALGAFVMADLWDHGVPLVLAVVAGLALAGVAHGLLGAALIRWFAEGTVGIKTAVTVGVFGALVALGARFFNSQYPRVFPTPLGGTAFTIASVAVTWLVVVSCLLAIALAAGASVFLNRTYRGLQLRALCDRPTTAELVGVPAPKIALLVWVVTGVFTGAAIMLVAPEFPSDFTTIALLITEGFAAGLVGSFQSFKLTLVGGLALGVAQGALSSLGSIEAYRGVVPTLVILALLLWRQREARWEPL